MLDIFSLCIVAEHSVVTTNSRPVNPPTASIPPRTAPHMPSSPRRSSRDPWAVFTRSHSVRGTLPWSDLATRCSVDDLGLCSNTTSSITTEVLCGFPQSLQENARKVSPFSNDRPFSNLHQFSATLRSYAIENRVRISRAPDAQVTILCTVTPNICGSRFHPFTGHEGP